MNTNPNSLNDRSAHPLRVVAAWALPLAALALPAQMASTEMALWLSSVLCVALVPLGPRTAVGMKVFGVLAASVLCSLALVNTGG